MKINNLKFLVKTNKWTAIFALALWLTACSGDDNDPVPIEEEETITTMTITLVPQGGGTTVTLQSRDLDGDGPNDPVITISGGSLVGNTTYSGSIVLLNETVDPVENVTEEVAEEDEQHQFFFAINGSIASLDYADQDGNGNPVGLSFTVGTLTAGPATLAVTLRHMPKKPNDGTLDDAGGETDIAQTFNLLTE